MGYRTSERLPLIEKAPSNQGMYLALYSLAAKNIGCKLTVVRAPKKRILKMLEQGSIDFYPGLGYTKQREKYLLYFANGLTSHTIALSHIDVADINHLAQMKGKTLLLAIGSNHFNAESYGIHVRQAHDLSLASAIKLLSQRRVDFYLYNKDSVSYYLSKQPNKDIKIHPCCFTEKAMYLGFSKLSKYAQVIINPNYNAKREGSVANLKEILSVDNKAYLFMLELQKLKQTQAISQLKAHFYPID